jgi:hypothetical protein
MEKPTTEQLLAVKRLLRYVAETVHMGCFYKTRKEKKLKLVGYSNNDLAGDIDTHKSTTGVLFFIGDSVISWQSQKQSHGALKL